MEGRADFGILDAITHAVRAVERRLDGLQSVATRHTAAATAALNKVAEASGDNADLRLPRHAALGDRVTRELKS